MNRTVSSILIPLLLVSQSLFSVSHSHAGSPIAESEGHAALPHIHLHGVHQHYGHQEDGDETPSSTGENVPDHDSDAVYTGNDHLLHDGKVAKVGNVELTALDFNCDDSLTKVELSRLWSQLDSLPVLRPKCALYMQFLSIRC